MKYTQHVCWCSENKAQHRLNDLGQRDILNSPYIKATNLDCAHLLGAVVAALKHQAWCMVRERRKLKSKRQTQPPAYRGKRT